MKRNNTSYYAHRHSREKLKYEVLLRIYKVKLLTVLAKLLLSLVNILLS